MFAKPALALLAVLALSVGTAIAAEVPDVSYATLEDHVTRVIDGDTLELRGGETVRLLGIDTPETGEPFFLDAKLFLFRLVCHKDVRIELDESKYDTYYRLLGHIYVETEDGWVLANTEIVRAGLADLLFIPPNERYHEYFEAVLYEAILDRREMWGTVPGTLTVAQLEADLVSCATEVVSIDFTIRAVDETDDEIVLYAMEGAFGFNARIPCETASEFGIESLADLVGNTATVTGFLSCEYRLGPYITVQTPSQLVLSPD